MALADRNAKNCRSRGNYHSSKKCSLIMLIPTASVQQTQAPGLVLIEDQVLSSTSTFDFQNIPGTYKHLLLEYQLRGSDAGGSVFALMRFNSDTGANYQSVQQKFNGSTTTLSQVSGSTSARIATVPAAGAASANLAVTGKLDIPNYASSS